MSRGSAKHEQSHAVLPVVLLRGVETCRGRAERNPEWAEQVVEFWHVCAPCPSSQFTLSVAVEETDLVENVVLKPVAKHDER